MRNSKNLFDDFVNKITIPESNDEVKAIAYLVFHHLFGLSATAILAGKMIAFTSHDQDKTETILHRINRHEPVQYILGVAEFYGRPFKVDSSVLIPRPETEELVREIITIHRSSFSNRKPVFILDIGTGSGCIPVTLALEIPHSNFTATDISESALAIATHNAAALEASVQFLKSDILTEELPGTCADIIVSNPPYIPFGEKETLNDNVTRFEPSLALFVDDTNPLLFYDVITKKAMRKLNKGGLLIFEIHERYGEEVVKILGNGDFNTIETVRDLSGKPRIVKGFRK